MAVDRERGHDLGDALHLGERAADRDRHSGSDKCDPTIDGRLLWEFTGMSTISIPTPFARHGLL